MRVFVLAMAAFALSACASTAQPAATATASAPAPDRYSDLYRKLHPSVAFITMQIPADDPKRKGAWDDAYGTGVVIASGAWGSRILTDAHVVADARHLRARIGDSGPTIPLTVIATSNDDIDLAVAEVRTPNLPPVTFGEPQAIVPGRPIGVIGYPIPDAFQDEHLSTVASIYAGHVASVRTGASGTVEIDVPVIPGESGGPVFDAETGDVLGLAESRFDDERAIGFATSVAVIAPFLRAHPVRINTAVIHDRTAGT